MIKRRAFFQKCAAFVAGCALGLGVRTKAIETVIESPPLTFNPKTFKGKWEWHIEGVRYVMNPEISVVVPTHGHNTSPKN